MDTQVLYTHLTPAEFRLRIAQAPVAYLPLGTLEWHGEHLPLGSDGMQSQGFFIQLAREIGGIVLPMLFLGPDLFQDLPEKSYYGMDIVGFPAGQPQQLDGSAYWLEDALFGEVLQASLAQLRRAGFKIVVAHGHGPSTRYFSTHSKAWEQQYGLKLFNCFDPAVGTEDEMGLQTDHAAANETSLMMALHPGLVHLENLSPEPDDYPLAIIGLDPRRFASAEKGQAILAKQGDRMAALLRAELETLGYSAGRGA
jgi:creatinine amidohydrolase